MAKAPSGATEAIQSLALQRSYLAMVEKPVTDTPIEEIHRTRREISARFGGDIAAIAEDAAKRQLASGRPVWTPKATEDGANKSDRALYVE